jgi:L-asparagine transporter-like permease
MEIKLINLYMKKNCPYMVTIFRSLYCDIGFLVFFVLLLLFLPDKIFEGYLAILGILFSLVFALSLTCMMKTITERAKSAKRTGHSILGVIMGLLGFSALHVCTIGLPFCSATIGLAVISSIFPVFLLDYLYEYPYIIIAISLLIQIYSLYSMKCFKRVDRTK